MSGVSANWAPQSGAPYSDTNLPASFGGKPVNTDNMGGDPTGFLNVTANGGSNPQSSLTFTLSAPVLTINDLTTGTAGSQYSNTPFAFLADMILTNGSTGLAGAPNTDPVGAPGPEVASGLPGVLAMVLFGGFMWWRRKLTFSLMP
jgi:hypothetical protein